MIQSFSAGSARPSAAKGKFLKILLFIPIFLTFVSGGVSPPQSESNIKKLYKYAL